MAKKYKVGEKFRVVSNTSGAAHYVIGEVYTVSSRQQGYVMGTNKDGRQIGQWIQLSDIEQVNLTVQELEKERFDLLEKVAEVDEKIAFLKATDLEVFDVDEYKVHKALAVLENTTDRVQQTKQLVKLFKSLS